MAKKKKSEAKILEKLGIKALNPMQEAAKEDREWSIDYKINTNRQLYNLKLHLGT